MKLKFSALLSDARGILNGSYASRDRYGSVLRNRVIPRNPQSQKQQMIRNIFSYVARRWRTISQHCRDEWTVYARTKPYTDVFGNRKFLQPNALFIQYNMNIMLYGFPFLECPIFENVEFPDIPITIDPPAVGGIWLYNMDKLSFYQMLVVQATRPTTAKKDNVDGDFTTIAVLKESDFIDGAYNAYQDYLNKIGPFENGQQIYFRYFFADPSGRVSLPKIAKTTTETKTPKFISTAYRIDPITNMVYITAKIINPPAYGTLPWEMWVFFGDDYMLCTNTPFSEELSQEEKQKLYAGEEVPLMAIQPNVTCVSYIFVIYNDDTQEENFYGLTHVNPYDFPIQ